MVSLGSLFSSHLVIFLFEKKNLQILSINGHQTHFLWGSFGDFTYLVKNRPHFLQQLVEPIHLLHRQKHPISWSWHFNFPTQIEVMMISALCTETKEKKPWKLDIMNFPFEWRFIHHLTLCQNPASINIDFTFSNSQNLIRIRKDSYLLKFFQWPWHYAKTQHQRTQTLPSQVCRIWSTFERILTFSVFSMTLTLCQNLASMNTDFAFSNLTEINPCWKRFVPSQIHRLWPTLERILTFWCSQNSTHLLERMLNFSNL
jgi:hypothetical protein